MYESGAGRELFAKNPFRPDVPSAPEAQYTQKISALARDFIYADRDIKTIEKEIEAAGKLSPFSRIENEKHGLESLRHLAKGIEAHEQANLLHGGAWQAVLIRQPARGTGQPKPPETLARHEVTREFEDFTFRQKLVETEKEALEEYRKLLALNAGAVVALSPNITLQRTDIEVLVNDLAVRAAERMAEDQARRARLQELDRELTKIIGRIPDDERGKRFELEEIYLLRRLIHAADTGHLASVSHGTPREDLRPDCGSVDIEITAAGDVFGFQLKTLKYGVSKTTREQQQAIIERARRKLRGAPTHLVVLEAEAVQNTFDASLRQAKSIPTSRADKFAALQPLTQALQGQSGHRLLIVLGLTEADMLREQVEFDQRYAKRQKLEAELARKRQEEARLEAEIEERKRQAEAEERVKKETRMQQQEADRQEARLARESVVRLKQKRTEQRQAERQEEQKQLAKLLAEKESETAEEKTKLAKKEAARLKREQKEKTAPEWPPQTLANLGSSVNLIKLGLLPADWKDDVNAFMAAKKRFIALFARPKNKNISPTEADKPNLLFSRIFPSRQSLESPADEDLRRLRDALNQK